MRRSKVFRKNVVLFDGFLEAVTTVVPLSRPWPGAAEERSSAKIVSQFS